MKKVNVTFEECNAQDLIKIASILGGEPVQIGKPTEEKQTGEKPTETEAQKKKRLAAEKKAKEEAQKAVEELAKAEAEKAAAEEADEMTFGVEEEEEEEGEEEVEPVDTKVLNKLMSDKMAANPDYKVQIVSRVTKTYKVKKVSELSPVQNVDFYKFLKGLK